MILLICLIYMSYGVIFVLAFAETGALLATALTMFTSMKLIKYGR